jgi:hypothetical protein
VGKTRNNERDRCDRLDEPHAPGPWPGLAPDEVRHDLRQYQGQLDEAPVLPALEPGRLVDQAADAALLDGVGMRRALREHGRELRAGRLGVAIEHVAPDQVRTTVAGERIDRAHIHLEDDSVDVADGDGAGEFSDPGV